MEKILKYENVILGLYTSAIACLLLFIPISGKIFVKLIMFQTTVFDIILPFIL